jgi:hypothetical protein
MSPTRSASYAPLLGLLAGGLVAAVVAACAQALAPARHRQAAAATEPEAAVAGAAAGDPRRYEIMELWGQIRTWRKDSGWAVEPAIPLNHPFILHKTVKDIRVCPSDPEPDPDDAICQDTCRLKDAICDNADSICRIAGDLDGDAWADEKCQSAKASCKEATEKCCECAASEPAAPPSP